MADDRKVLMERQKWEMTQSLFPRPALQFSLSPSSPLVQTGGATMHGPKNDGTRGAEEGGASANERLRLKACLSQRGGEEGRRDGERGPRGGDGVGPVYIVK